MQRSPIRKSPRLQTAMSQNTSSSTSAGTKSVVQQNVSSAVGVSTQSISSTAAVTTPIMSTATISAPIETSAVSSQNIFGSINESSQCLPPLVPGPNVRNQPPQIGPSANVSTDMRSLQNQIDLLQAQLANAQRALKAAESTNCINIGQNMATVVNTEPTNTSNNSAPEDIVDRLNPTPYSFVSNDVNVSQGYQQQHLLAAPPLSVQSATLPMPIQRKIYDLPEFNGTPEDWPMFLSALEHSTAAYLYNNFENCLRLQKALKGEAKECVKSLLIHPNNVPTVIEQLKLQYGRPDLLIRCQLQQIREIQPILESAVDKLIPYSIKVRNLAAFLETANGQPHLSNPTLMEELVQKLPMSKRLDWAQYAST